MQKTSCNVIFVYILLVVDLGVNIIDNLLSSLPKSVFSYNNHHEYINKLAFTLVVIQILAIIFVVVDLALYLLEIAEKVRQFAWLQQCNDGEVIETKTNAKFPMPQRLALKLVLDKYWWSLMVGLLYLVLTIILQIVRLDPSWHPGTSLPPSLGRENSAKNDDRVGKNLRMDPSELIVTNYHSESALNNNNNYDSVKPTMISNDDLTVEPTMVPINKPMTRANLEQDFRLEDSLPPIMFLLIHKLLSTCYYVSFVVMYRATPNQMMNRIFCNKAQPSSEQRLFQFNPQ